MHGSREPILFQRYPALRGRVPWIELGRFPTPIEPLARLGEHLKSNQVYVKRDDIGSDIYGGNKVRKLEFTLGDALAKGRDPIITAGAVGSNHIVATTVHASKLGLSVVGIVVPQPVQQYLRTNVLCCSHLGCRLLHVPDQIRGVLKAGQVYLAEWTGNRRRPYVLWVGGSSTLGVLGYVEGALEIAEQVGRGVMPEPRFVFVPVGSSGTLAGLVLGLKLAGLRTKAVGVRVYERTFANSSVTAFLANRALQYLRRRDPSIPWFEVASNHFDLLHNYFGRGYARYTRKAVEAMQLASELEGMRLEGTYSGKAFAAFVDFMRVPTRSDTPVLFVNTYNSVPLDPLLESCPGPQMLPHPIQQYFAAEIAPVDPD